MSDIGNYASHARYWDWGGFDRTPEHEYWRKYAEKYGKNVLIPMCALGETGAYMAQRGMNVTAFDITPEMIYEGEKRFSGIEGLRLLTGDVRNFCFDIQPVDFCFSMDFQHLLTVEDVMRALKCIYKHMRYGGCLVIETCLHMQGAQSGYTPVQTFYPQKQLYPGIKVWKKSATRNDAEAQRCYYLQTFYAQHDDGSMETFEHSFYLRSYTRECWLNMFAECGYGIINEYNNREVDSWLNGSDAFRIFEVIKTK